MASILQLKGIRSERWRMRYWEMLQRHSELALDKARSGHEMSAYIYATCAASYAHKLIAYRDRPANRRTP